MKGPAARIELRAVEFAYARGAAPGRPPFRLGPVDVALGAREILGIIGPNSAGKTTLVRLVTGLLAPSAGVIRLEGRALGEVSATDLARSVAVVPQEVPGAFPFTVGELVMMGRYPHAPGRFFEGADDVEVARAAMTTAGVLELAGRPLSTLGGGERQRAVIARALAQEPRLLVLDEPTAHLDLRHQVACAALLRELAAKRGLAIVLVSHDLGLAAALCDRLLLLAEGRPVRLGTPAAVLEAGLLSEVYGCPVLVDACPDRPGMAVRVVWPGRGADA